jgi:NADH-quinone oxidoreductase subunit C
MDVAAIQKKLEGEFGGAVGPVQSGVGGSWIEVDPEKIDGVCRLLHDDPDTRFDSLSNLSGVDYPEHGHIQVVYNLISYEHGGDMTIKTNADRNAPTVRTVCEVWKTANWLEREVYDLLGVDFTGHPDLRRILLPDDWIGYPLRKDYVEAPEYHGISTVRESMLKIDIPGRS